MPQKKKAPSKKVAVKAPKITPEEAAEGVVLVKDTVDNILRATAKLSEVDEVIKRAELKAKEPVGRHSKNFLAEVEALEYFADGMLFDQFKLLNYPVEWRKGEVRHIPLWLLERCKQSGGEFEVLNG